MSYSVIDPQGNTTSYTYDGAGSVESQRNGNGNTTTFQYNSDNLLTAKIDPAGMVIRQKPKLHLLHQWIEKLMQQGKEYYDKKRLKAIAFHKQFVPV